MSTRGRAKGKLSNSVEVELNQYDQLMLSVIVQSIDDLDLMGSRMVSEIIDKAELESFRSVNPSIGNAVSVVCVLSGYELNLMKDNLDKMFTSKKVLGVHAKAATHLNDVLEDALAEVNAAEEPAED